MRKFNVAVVGATGMVGRKMLEVLSQHNFPVGELYPYSSAKSAGTQLEFNGKKYTVLELKKENITGKNIDFALFSAGASVSKEYAPVFAQLGTIVVDNSSQWRRDPDIPLVVPEVNADALKNHRNIIANPNCSTIQAMVVLGPLHEAFGLKRVIYSTYQAVSGAGVAGCADLEEGAKGLPPKKFPRPIYNNCLPHIDVFLDNGYTKEEDKMVFETRKILGLPELRVTATCVRVPIMNAHSESINIEFEKPATPEAVREVLAKAKGVTIMDDPANLVYPTALDASGQDNVLVGRIRKDFSVENGINMWIVADNIRKGAATNTVQIARYMIDNDIKPVKL